VLAAKSLESLWLSDLDEFEVSYKTYCKKKTDIYNEAQKVQVKPVKAKKAKV